MKRQSAPRPSAAAVYWCTCDSPVGELLLAGDGEALTHLSFGHGKGHLRPDPAWREDPRPFRRCVRQLREYFAGKRRDFDLALRPVGTAFQESVWQSIRTVPYGEMITYGELARRSGRPRAVRPAGLAAGANPLAIVIPCHRIIGADGSLTGFGGGLDIKWRLLVLEGAQGPRSPIPGLFDDPA